MNRLIMLILVVGLLMASSVHGDTTYSTSSTITNVKVFINGIEATNVETIPGTPGTPGVTKVATVINVGDIITLGDTVKVTCQVSASATISDTDNSSRAMVDGSITCGSWTGTPSWIMQDEADPGETASKSYNNTNVYREGTPTLAGSYKATINSNARAIIGSAEVDWVYVTTEVYFTVVDVIQVEIDIKPGSDPNPINPGSNGLIPVAILTTNDFDAANVDPGTVTLAGADVAVRGKSEKLMAHLEDVDGDGDIDLLLQVDTQSEDALWEEGEVFLEGFTYDDTPILGSDYVVIVPPE